MAPKKDANAEIKFVLRLGPIAPPEQDDRPQQIDFEFVHGKDKESRRRVRRHVMRGWRQNKKKHFNAEVEKTRGQLDWAAGDATPELSCDSCGGSTPSLYTCGLSDISSPRFGDSDADWDWDEQVLQHYDHLENQVFSMNVSEGLRTDSFDGTSAPFDQKQHLPLGHDERSQSLNDLPAVLLGSPPTSRFNPFRDLAFAPAMQDFTPFHPLLLSSAHHHASLQGPELLNHKLEAIRLMQEALQDPVQSTTDEMIQTAIYIAGDEVCPLDLMHQDMYYDVARIHLSGIRRMIKLQNSHPDASRFSHRLEVQVLGAECFIPTAQDSIIFDPSDLLSEIEELIAFFTNLKCLTSSQSRPKIPYDSLLYKVLSTPPDTSTTGCSYHLQQFGQLASLFYVCSALVSFSSTPSSSSPSTSSPKPTSFISALESQLLDLLSYTKFQGAPTFPALSEMLFWIMLSGLDYSAFDNRERGWRVTRLMHAVKMLSLGTRNAFRDWMLEFLSDGRVHAFDPDQVRREVFGSV